MRKDWRDELADKGLEYKEGFQIKKIRRPRKDAPEWASSLKAIENHLFLPQRRRVRITYLFWVVGLNAREVAGETGETVRAVERVLDRLRR